MTWHDRIENIVSQRARLQKCHFERVYGFWNQTILKSNFFFPGKLFFSTLSRAQLGKPDWSRIFDRVTKKFTTKLRCIPHASVQWHALCSICEFFVLKLFEILKVNRNMFFISINRHFDTIFYSKFIYNFRTDFIESGYSVLLGKLDPQRTENKISIIQSRAKNLRQTFFITKEWLIQKSSKYLLNSSFSSGEHYQVYFLI